MSILINMLCSYDRNAIITNTFTLTIRISCFNQKFDYPPLVYVTDHYLRLYSLGDLLTGEITVAIVAFSSSLGIM